MNSNSTTCPQEIPDGYTMTFVSDPSAQQDLIIRYENDAGYWLTYRIYITDPASSFGVYDIEKKMDVSINGHAGIGGSRALIWADPERHVVYHLHSEDVTGEELLKVAQSIIVDHG